VPCLRSALPCTIHRHAPAGFQAFLHDPDAAPESSRPLGETVKALRIIRERSRHPVGWRMVIARAVVVCAAGLERRVRMKTSTVRAGMHIEGVHWMAEYAKDVHEIRVFRDKQEVDVHNAPSTLFGDEENAGSKSTADHRAVEAALLAYLRRFVIEHDSEE
jgi:hypothetical protein